MLKFLTMFLIFTQAMMQIQIFEMFKFWIASPWKRRRCTP